MRRAQCTMAAVPAELPVPWWMRAGSSAAIVLASVSAGMIGFPTILVAALCSAFAPQASLFTALLVASGAAKYFPVNFLAMCGGMATMMQMLYRLIVWFSLWSERLRGPPSFRERYEQELALREAQQDVDDGLGIFAFSFGNLLLWIYLALPPPFPS